MKIPVIRIKPFEYHGQYVVGIFFDYNPELIELVKRLPNARWSPENKFWYIPYDNSATHMLRTHFHGIGIIDPISGIQPPEKQKNSPPALPNAEAIDYSMVDSLRQWMEYKRYSDSSIRSYCAAVLVFCRFLKPKPTSRADNTDVVRFVNEYVLRYHFSSSYQNQTINALKLFFREVKKSEVIVECIERPRKERRLPDVLSKEEVLDILRSLSNIKHKTMLTLIYSCGLRRSELLKLRPLDVDSKRGLLLIRQAKGKKDRVAPLPEKMVEMLRKYYMAYRPIYWLFEGHEAGKPYSEQSLQNVLKKAVRLAGNKKRVTLHWLRHSYATHLLESGTDLRYIQEILGHKSPRTTEIYTHVSTKQLQKIKSPIDDMDI